MLPPEQCRGGKVVTDRSDVYSLGVVLFEVLAGRLPFLAEGSGELIAEHIGSEPPPLASVATELPPRLTQLVDDMLKKSPTARPGMDQVLTTLSDLLAELPPGTVSRPSYRISVRVPSENSRPSDAFLPTFPQGISVPAEKLTEPRSRVIKRLASVAALSLLTALTAHALTTLRRPPPRVAPAAATLPPKPEPAPTSPHAATADLAPPAAVPPPAEKAPPAVAEPVRAPAANTPAPPPHRTPNKRKSVKRESIPSVNKEKLEYEE